MTHARRLGQIALTLLGAATAAAFAPPEAAGQGVQWILAADVTTGGVTGGLRETTELDEDGDFRPYRPITYGLRVSREGARVGYAVALRAATPALALHVADDVFVDDDVGFTFTELAPEISYVLMRSRAGVSLRGHAGPIVDLWLWSISDETVVRLGARSGLRLHVPLGSRFVGLVEGALAYSGSPFAETDAPPGFERRSMVRTEVGLGVAYVLKR